MTPTAVSVIVPAYREQDGIGRVLDRLIDAITLEFEILVVVDDESDPTVAAVRDHVAEDAPVRTLVNT
ncbi:MAG TPA: glycosyltransferase, partial [Nocardioides sp.]|nr:glycosyltransferase [Nocardioides sp.]